MSKTLQSSIEQLVLIVYTRPSNELLASTMLGNVVSTLLAVYAFPEPLDSSEIITIWVFLGDFWHDPPVVADAVS